MRTLLKGTTHTTARRQRPALTRAVSLAAAGTLFGASSMALAQKSPTERIDELERKLEQSLKQIEQLSNEVSRLRGAQAKPAAPAPEQATQQAAKIEELERQVAQISDTNAARGSLKFGMPLHGFADVGAGYSRQSNIYQSGPKGFKVSNFSLYLTPEYGERVKSLIELVFEVDRNGDLAVDLERVQIGYTFSDAATLWAGRFHTPYGIWNTAYHHGAQIQTALSRPRFLEFEDLGGILPAHTVGAWLTGTLPLGGTRLQYDLYTGNGPRIGLDPSTPGGNLNANVGGDDNHSLQVGLRAALAPRGALDGLKLGVHALRANVHDDTATQNRTRLFTYGGFASYTTDRWEILSEVYKFRNRDLSGGTGTHSSSAWYAQAGYNIGRFTPYARFERTSLNQADNYFAVQNSGRSYETSSLGLRFDLTNSVALKFEAGRTTLRNVTVTGGDDRFNEFRTQFAIRF